MKPEPNEKYLRADHLNLRWSLADMDRLKKLAASHSATAIATIMGCTKAEIIDLCERNAILVRVA